MISLRRLLLVVMIVLSCVGCDQITKTAARHHLPHARPMSSVGDVFRLHYRENTGAFLGLGSTMRSGVRFWVLCVATGLATAGMLVLVLAKRNLSRPAVVGLSFIIGGGIGNLIDRTANEGAVIDFMNIGIGGLRTGIFNVADVAIMAGVVMLILFASRSMQQTHSA
jgi:signal peptidase II